MNCAKARLRAYPPSGLTSRMIGFPATCRNVVPTPSAKIHASSSANPGARSAGTITATPLIARPSRSSRFLPMRAPSTPPGTLNTAKAMKTKKGNSVESTLLSR